MANVHPLSVELAYDFRTFATNWNIGTSRWLREVIYEPLVREAGWNPSQAIILTFIICAYWHGLDPGYYITWFYCALVDILCKSKLRSLYSLGIILNVCGWVGVFVEVYKRFTWKLPHWTRHLIIQPPFNMLMNYVFAGYCLRDLEKIWQFYWQTRFAGHVVILLSLFLVNLFTPRHRHPHIKQE